MSLTVRDRESGDEKIYRVRYLLACDGGAPETFLRDDSERAVAVYFEWRADAGDFLTLMKPPGAQPGELMFVDMLRITRDCV